MNTLSKSFAPLSFRMNANILKQIPCEKEQQDFEKCSEKWKDIPSITKRICHIDEIMLNLCHKMNPEFKRTIGSHSTK